MNLLIGYIYVAISALAYGFSPILGKYIYQLGVTPAVLLSLRFIMATGLLWLMVLATRQSSHRPAASFRKFCAAQAVAYLLSAICFFNAIKYLDASIASVILFTYPLIVAGLAVPVFREHLSLIRLLALLAAFIGCCLVINPGTGLSISPWGALLAIGASVFYAIHGLISQRTVAGTPPLVVSAHLNTMIMVLTLFILPPTYLWDGSMPWPAGGLILGLVFSTSVVGMIMFLGGIKRIGASRASIVSSMEPAFTIGLAFWLLGERMNLLQLVGAAAILLGILLLQAEHPDAAKDTPAEKLTPIQQ